MDIQLFLWVSWVVIFFLVAYIIDIKDDFKVLKFDLSYYKELNEDLLIINKQLNNEVKVLRDTTDYKIEKLNKELLIKRKRARKMKKDKDYIDTFKLLDTHSSGKYEHINLENWKLYLRYLVEVLEEDLDKHLYRNSPSIIAFEMNCFMKAYIWIKNN